MPRVVPGTSDGVVVEVLPDTKALNRAGGEQGVRQTRRLLGNGGEGKEGEPGSWAEGGVRGVLGCRAGTQWSRG